MMYKQAPMPMVHAGLNSIEQITNILKNPKKERIGIITDKGIRASGLLDILTDCIPKDVEYIVDDSVETDPSSESVDRIAADVRRCGGVDLIIGLGGGSSLDTAKIASVLLKQVKQKYPEIIPVNSYRSPGPDADGNPRVIYASLPIAGLEQRYFEIDGKWRKYWEHPNFVELLKFANTLYNENLIDSSEFTDKEDQIRAKIWGGRVFSELRQDADNLGWFSGRLQNVKPEWNFVCIKPFTIDPSSMEYASDTFGGGTGGNRGIVVPKGEKAKYAVEWLDFILDEQTQLELMYGLEGVSHEMKGGLPFTTEEKQAAAAKVAEKELDPEEFTKQFGFQFYWPFRIDGYNRIEGYYVQLPKTPFMKTSYEITGQYYKDFSKFKGLDVFPQESEVLKVWSTIKDYYSQAVFQIVSGKPADVESKYADMVAKMKDLGLETLNDFWTEKINGIDKEIQIYSADF